jgi:hypothetical protein
LPIVGLDGRPISSSKNPGFSSGGTNNADHIILPSSKIFQSAVVPGGRNSNPPPSAKSARWLKCKEKHSENLRFPIWEYFISL